MFKGRKVKQVFSFLTSTQRIFISVTKQKSRQHSTVLKTTFRADNHLISTVTLIKHKCGLLTKGTNGSCPLVACSTHLISNAIPGRLKCPYNWAATQLAMWPQNICGWKFMFWDLLFSQISCSAHCGATQALQTRSEAVIFGSSRQHLSQIKMLNKIRPLTFYWLWTQVESCTRWVLSSRAPYVKGHSLTYIQLFRRASCPEQVTSISDTGSITAHQKQSGQNNTNHHHISTACNLSLSYS